MAADEEILVKIKVDTEEAGKSLKQLRGEYKQQLSELEGLAVGSAAYVNQLKKIGAIKDEIGDLNTTIKAFNPEGKIQSFSTVIGGMASGFQAAQGAAALFGTESKDVEKALLKVQSAMAFSEGIKGIVGLEDGFKNLGAVIKASFATNPFGVILLGVTALGTALTALYYSLDKSSESTRKLNEEAEKQKDISDSLSKSTKRQVDLLTAQGASEEVIVATKKRLINQQILEMELNIKLHQSKLRDIQDNDGITESIWGVQKALYEKLGLTKQAEAFDKMIQVNKAERAKEDLDAIKKEKEDLLDLKNSIAVLDAEVVVNKEKQAEKLAKIRKATVGNYETIEKISVDNIGAIQEQGDKDMMARFNKNQAIIQKSKDDLAILNEKRRIALNKEEINNALDIGKQTLQATANLADAVFAIKRSNLVKGSKEELKVAKQQFEVNKALQLSIATITGIMSVMEAYKNGMKNPIPLLGPATGTAYAVIAGVTAAANIGKIASTQFTGGAGSSGGGGGDTGSVPTAIAPPTINAPSSSSTQLNADGTVKSMNNQPTTKVIVVESDITSKQRQVAMMEQNASV